MFLLKWIFKLIFRGIFAWARQVSATAPTTPPAFNSTATPFSMAQADWLAENTTQNFQKAVSSFERKLAQTAQRVFEEPSSDPATTPQGATNTTATEVPTDLNELQAELAELRAELRRLKQWHQKQQESPGSQNGASSNGSDYGPRH